jgi:alanyl-tRNA synthetase
MQWGDKKSCVTEVPDADGKLLGAVADALKSRFTGPTFLVGATNGRVSLVATVPKEMTSNIQANKLIQEIAPIVGGKGGGRPDSAQGGGSDTGKIGDAIQRAKEIFAGAGK